MRARTIGADQDCSGAWLRMQQVLVVGDWVSACGAPGAAEHSGISRPPSRLSPEINAVVAAGVASSKSAPRLAPLVAAAIFSASREASVTVIGAARGGCSFPKLASRHGHVAKRGLRQPCSCVLRSVAFIVAGVGAREKVSSSMDSRRAVLSEPFVISEELYCVRAELLNPVYAAVGACVSEEVDETLKQD
eukprot:IDg12415t1